MAATPVGIREFRTKLAEYVLHSEEPIAVTRHGETVGYFIPARVARKESDRAALRQAATKLDAMLRDAGFTEAELDDAARNFRAWRKTRK